MNSPAKSKINYTAILMALIGVAIQMDVLPEALRDDALTLASSALIVGGMLVGYFRTWKTGAKTDA